MEDDISVNVYVSDIHLIQMICPVENLDNIYINIYK